MSESVIAVGEVYAAVAKLDEVRGLLREHRDRISTLPGQRGCQIAVALDAPEHFLITQEWEDVDALRAYGRSDALHDFQRRLFGLTTRPWKLELHLVRESLALDEFAPTDPRRAD